MVRHPLERGVACAVASLVVLSMAACDRATEDQRGRVSELAAQTRTPPPVDEAAPIEGELEAESKGQPSSDGAEEAGEVAEIAVVEIAVERDPGTDSPARELTSSSVDPTPAQPSWEARARLDGALAFAAIAEGLALVGDAGVSTVSAEDGSLGPIRTVELPDAQAALLGRWPDDVWRLDLRPAGEAAQPDALEHQLLHLDEAGQWQVQPYRKRERFVLPPDAVRAGGPGGGLIVLEDKRVWRVGSRHKVDKVGHRMGKVVLAAIETRAGVLHNISLRTNGVYVQRYCPDRGCVGWDARRLPHGSAWRFETSVLRAEDAFTVLTRVEIDDMKIEHLLHRGGDSWELESLGEAPAGMWGSAGGGLWLQMGAALWYRSPGGSWHDVELPGEGAISVGWSAADDQLWLAQTGAEQTELFAIDATPSSLL